MSTSALELPPPVRSLTPAARLVYLALLRAEAPLSTDNLVTQTGLSRQSVRRVMTDLEECDLAEANRHPTDGRRKLYEISTSESDHRKTSQI